MNRKKYIIPKGCTFVPYGDTEDVLALEEIDIRSSAEFAVMLQDNSKTTIQGFHCPHIVKTLREHRNLCDLLIHISDDLYEEGLTELAYDIAMHCCELTTGRMNFENVLPI